MRSRIILGLIIALLFQQHRAAGGKAGFQVRFGTFVLSESRQLEFEKETTVVPMHLIYTGRVHGFQIVPPDERFYTVQMIAYPPAPPRNTYGAESGLPPDAWRTGIRSKEYRTSGPEAIWRGFTPGDPLGLHRLDLFIDGERVKSVQFQVVPPGSTESP